MNKYSMDEKVFIRSLGNHGDLGGLSRKSHEIGDVLAASGKDYIFLKLLEWDKVSMILLILQIFVLLS